MNILRKYINIINENDDQENLIRETLKKDCSDILNIYNNTTKVLYRGLKHDRDPFIHKKIRTDRKPLDLNVQIHNMFNDALSNMGFIAHRGNSIFTTPNINIANNWGEVYIVFPINGFKYTWFKRLPTNEYAFNYIRNRKDPDSIKKLIEYLEPSSTNIEEAINKGTEVLIQSDKGYYAVDWFFYDRNIKWFKK